MQESKKDFLAEHITSTAAHKLVLSQEKYVACDDIVSHLDGKKFRSFRGVAGVDIPTDIFKLRYEVYCLECAFLHPDDFYESMEMDEYEECSTHFAAYTLDDTLVGTVRLVQPGINQSYPFERFCHVFDPSRIPAREHAVEISRLVVRKNHRRRRADSMLGAPGMPLPHLVEAEHHDGVERRQHDSPMLLLGLYREMYRHSRELGIRYWFAAMERSLARSLERMGFRFHPIGPATDYFGLVTPYMVDLNELEVSLRKKNIGLAEWFMQKTATL